MSRLFTSLPGDEGLPGPRRWPAIAVVMIGTTMAVLDGTITNVALPTIAQDLGIEPALSIWVVNAYQLAAAVSIVALAALGDVIGYRRIYTVGLLVFTAASLACALSHALMPLVICRFIQGAGASAMMSVGPALYRSIFPGRLLGSALGLSALTVASSAAAGPTVGGLLLSVLNWPWLFAVNLPIGLYAIILAGRSLPRDAGRGGQFDLPGAALVGLAMGSFVISMNALSTMRRAKRSASCLLCAWRPASPSCEDRAGLPFPCSRRSFSKPADFPWRR